MKFPKGKGFDLACGVVITVFLDDCMPLTGTFLGNVHDHHHHGRRDEFILIQLTHPFAAKGGTKLPAGTFCAINIEQILFIVPGKKNCNCKCHDDECPDEKDDDGCHDNHDDECGYSIWESEIDDKHVININCNRAEERQRIINISCNTDSDKGSAESDGP